MMSPASGLSTNQVNNASGGFRIQYPVNESHLALPNTVRRSVTHYKFKLTLTLAP